MYYSNIGINAQLCGIQETTQIFGIKHSVATYWLKKQQNPTFHANTHGGARLVFFKENIYIIKKFQILSRCQMNI